MEYESTTTAYFHHTEKDNAPIKSNLVINFESERDWELMTLLSSELKNLGPWKKGENFFLFVRQYGRR